MAKRNHQNMTKDAQSNQAGFTGRAPRDMEPLPPDRGPVMIQPDDPAGRSVGRPAEHVPDASVNLDLAIWMTLEATCEVRTRTRPRPAPALSGLEFVIGRHLDDEVDEVFEVCERPATWRQTRRCSTGLHPARTYLACDHHHHLMETCVEEGSGCRHLPDPTIYPTTWIWEQL